MQAPLPAFELAGTAFAASSSSERRGRSPAWCPADIAWWRQLARVGMMCVNRRPLLCDGDPIAGSVRVWTELLRSLASEAACVLIVGAQHAGSRSSALVSASRLDDPVPDEVLQPCMQAWRAAIATTALGDGSRRVCHLCAGALSDGGSD